jgi:predicted nucleic acid-binding protein
MTAAMSGRSFVDTNVVVCAADENPADRRKHDIAVKLLADEPESLVLSTQVLLEFYQVVTRQLAKPLDLGRANAAVRALTKMDIVGSDAQLVLAAIDTSRSAQISIWDALIIEAAREADCDRVLTEDLSDGQVIRGVRVENPFRDLTE